MIPSPPCHLTVKRIKSRSGGWNMVQASEGEYFNGNDKKRKGEPEMYEMPLAIVGRDALQHLFSNACYK